VTPVVVALIALVGSVVGSVLFLLGQDRLARRSELREAERALRLYREPLISAAYDLQSRIYHLLRRDLLVYVREDRWGRRDAAVATTAFAFAQYFGWREILRREVQLLEFETRELGRLLNRITGAIGDDGFGSKFLLWTAEQRAVGEAMIGTWRGAPACVGYGEFRARREAVAPWLGAFTRDLAALAESGGDDDRLVAVQHLLVELIETLDPDRVRHVPLERV
jgi:hypothetical protein